jgi:hypothetical protein
VDLIASEYGWTINQIMETPIDITPQLEHAILTRRGVVCFYRTIIEGEAPKSLLSERAKLLGSIDTTL